MKEPKKILIRSPNWIGDHILAFPFFYYLRKAYPRAKISVACVPWVQSIQYRDLVDEVLVLPRPLQTGFRARVDSLEQGAKLLRDLGPWDLGITLPNSFSSAWLLFRANVATRRGFAADARSLLLNQAVPLETRFVQHRAESYLSLLPEGVKPDRTAKEFWGVPPANELDPGVPGVLESFAAERSWPDAEPVDPPEGPYWVLAPGSTAESRRWPIDRFARLVRLIQEETSWPGVIVGGPAEVDAAEQLCRDGTLKLIDYTAQGSVAANWRIFQKAKFSVCNDSGLAHLASLCGSPVQIVWGGGDPRRTDPIGPGKVQILFNPVSCWPCERNQCSQPAENKLACLKGVTEAETWKEIQTGIKPKNRNRVTGSDLKT